MKEIPGKLGWFPELCDIDPQKRIHEWAEATFGSATYVRHLFDRVKAEMKELDEEIDIQGFTSTILEAKQNNAFMEKIKSECADVVITLFRFAGALGFDLLNEVHRKQSINEIRKWRSHGDGTGQHIKNTEA